MDPVVPGQAAGLDRVRDRDRKLGEVQDRDPVGEVVGDP